MKTVCLIPARGGSKRIPNKNIVLLKNKPLLGSAIEKAKKVKEIEEVWVSTESKKIKEVALQYGAKIIDRPEELASDTAKSESVMLHFANQLDFDNLLLFECVYPLTTVEDIDQLINKYNSGNWDSILSLKRTTYYIWKINNDGTTYPSSYKLGYNLRTQDYEGLYIESGGLYLTSKKALLKSKCYVSGKIGYYILPHPSFQIDTWDDFKIVEALL